MENPHHALLIYLLWWPRSTSVNACSKFVMSIAIRSRDGVWGCCVGVGYKMLYIVFMAAQDIFRC